MRMLVVSTIFALIAPIVSPATVSAELAFAFSFQVRTLDGSANNLGHVDWGRANTVSLRVAPANYADGVSAMVAGPSARYVSNRVFNDVGQNLFSENHLPQLVWVWGQFMDHDFALRDQTPAEHAPTAFNTADRLAAVSHDLEANKISPA